MNDSQKILYEFNRQHDRVLDAIAAGRFATSPGPSCEDPMTNLPVAVSQRHPYPAAR